MLHTVADGFLEISFNVKYPLYLSIKKLNGLIVVSWLLALAFSSICLILRLYHHWTTAAKLLLCNVLFLDAIIIVSACGAYSFFFFKVKAIRNSKSGAIRKSESSTIRKSENSTIRISEGSTIRKSESYTIRISESSTIRKSESSTIRKSESSTIRKSESSTIGRSPEAMTLIWKKFKLPCYTVLTYVFFNFAATLMLAISYVHAQNPNKKNYRRFKDIAASLDVIGFASDSFIYVFVNRNV